MKGARRQLSCSFDDLFNPVDNEYVPIDTVEQEEEQGKPDAGETIEFMQWRFSSKEVNALGDDCERRPASHLYRLEFFRANRFRRDEIRRRRLDRDVSRTSSFFHLVAPMSVIDRMPVLEHDRERMNFFVLSGSRTSRYR